MFCPPFHKRNGKNFNRTFIDINEFLFHWCYYKGNNFFVRALFAKIAKIKVYGAPFEFPKPIRFQSTIVGSSIQLHFNVSVS